MAGRWWLDQDDGAARPVAPARASPVAAVDPAKLSDYRASLAQQATRLPRGSVRRRAIEKRLVALTAQILRGELKRAGS